MGFGGDPAMRTPTRRTPSTRCACAMNGHAKLAPPASAMNSRRLTEHTPHGRDHKFRIADDLEPHAQEIGAPHLSLVADGRSGPRTDEPPPLPVVTERDSSTPSNGPVLGLHGEWRCVPGPDSCTAPYNVHGWKNYNT